MILSFAVVFSMMPGAVFADAADSINVLVTVSNAGTIAKGSDNTLMAGVSVGVTDENSDGKITVDEVMKAVHEKYCADGYATSESSYGTSVTKLWGKETTNTLFFVNNAGINTGVAVDTVSDGDYVVASVNSDDINYADWYTYFDNREIEVFQGEEFALQLNGHLGMAYEEADKTDVSISKVSIGKVSETGFQIIDEKTTDKDGKVKISFAEPGTYYVSASGTVKDEVSDWTAAPYDGSVKKTVDCPIIAPYCKVTVNSYVEYAKWEGQGTETSPYIINSFEDLQKLQTLCNDKGINFSGKYFKLNDDITLSSDWVPIGTLKSGQTAAGNGKNINPFSGCFDGNNKTITVAENGKPLFGYVREATVKNLNIYGSRIDGYGLINNYAVDYGADGVNKPATNPKYAAIIDNCTLKQGSQTLYSGFIGGYASGVNIVTIRNSEIEKGVTIGYDKSQNNIGGFAGEFNGYIINCINHGDVYGVKFVGGICANKGQSMGPCNIYDSVFDGSLEAAGAYSGGILGAGYGGAGFGFAANAQWPVVENCMSSGNIKGNDFVGGILGAEPGTVQCWANGTGYIQNNLFTGKISATNENANVGGVIGYINALNRFTVITNNYFDENCGAAKGVGKIKYIENEETDGQKLGSGWATATMNNAKYGRDDDPEGADADKLAKAYTEVQLKNGTVRNALNAGLNSSGNWVQDENTLSFTGEKHLISITSSEISTSTGLTQLVNGNDVLEGKTLVLTYSDGTAETVPATKAKKEYTISEDMAGKYIGASIVYNNHQLVFLLLIKSGGSAPVVSDDNITVKFSLLGDSHHGEGTVHTLKNGGLTTWISEYSVTVPKDSKVMDLIVKVLNEKGYSWKNDNKINGTGNYIQKIITDTGVSLEELDNGPNSGWMYTLNGSHPLLGVSEQSLKDGDVIVFHYTDDYTKEEGSDKWNTPVEEIKNVTTSGTDTKITTAPTEVKTSGNTATATVTDENSKELIKQAKENKSAEIVINVSSSDAKDAETVNLELDKKTVEGIVSDTDAAVTVKTPTGEINLDKETLKQISGEAEGDTIVIEITKVTKPEEAQKALVGANGQIIKLAVKSGNKVISDFKGTVTVRLAVPAALKDKNIAAVYIENGDLEKLEGKRITQNKEEFYEFTTNRLGEFALVDTAEVKLDGDDTREENIVKAKSLIKELKLKAVSSKTAKKNVKVTTHMSSKSNSVIKELSDMGFTVKYKYYRSVKKASKYTAVKTKTSRTYINTKGKRGTKYYYKVRAVVYDGDKVIAQSALKQCSYAARKWTR